MSIRHMQQEASEFSMNMEKTFFVKMILVALSDRFNVLINEACTLFCHMLMFQRLSQLGRDGQLRTLLLDGILLASQVRDVASEKS